MIDRERLLQTFLDLVRIDSETGYEAAAAAYCRARLAALGLTVEEDDAGPALGGDCGNLFAFLPARGADQPTIMVNAHLDTVVPGRGVQPVIEEGVVRSDGRTVLGADNKTGLAVILEALSVLQERRPPHAAVQVVLTVSEEVGLRGARHVARERLIADFGYTLDSDIVGGVVVRAPGYHRIDARIIGLAAHAGVHPEQGLSAAVIAARAVARTPLGKLDERTTANVGRLVAGVARNVVPAEARLEAGGPRREPARPGEAPRQSRGTPGRAGTSVETLSALHSNAPPRPGLRRRDGSSRPYARLSSAPRWSSPGTVLRSSPGGAPPTPGRATKAPRTSSSGPGRASRISPRRSAWRPTCRTSP